MSKKNSKLTKIVTITPLHWPTGYESRWFQKLSLSRRDHKAWDVENASVSKVGCQVAEEVPWYARIDVTGVLVWWKKLLIDEQE